MVRVEVAAAGGRVLLVITGPPSLAGVDSVAVSMSADECRALSNSLGEMILAVSKPGVMAHD